MGTVVVLTGGHRLFLRLFVSVGCDQHPMAWRDHAHRWRFFFGGLGMAVFQAGRPEGLRLENAAIKDRLELIDSAETFCFESGRRNGPAGAGIIRFVFDDFG